MKVLVIAAKNAFVAELGTYLTLEGNRVTLACSCDALALTPAIGFDVALVRLEEMASDAAEIVLNVRTNYQGTPILVLNAAHGSTLPVSTASMSGSSVTNPKVLAWLRAIVRRSQGYSEPVLQAGMVQLNRAFHEVLVNGTQVELTPREFDLLEVLMLCTDTSLTKEVLLTHLYGGVDEPSPKIVDVLVCNLRRKLDQAGAKIVIITIYRQGYMISGASKTNVQFPRDLATSLDLNMTIKTNDLASSVQEQTRRPH